MMLTPVTTIKPATTIATAESMLFHPGDLDERKAMQHPGGGEGVRAEMRGIPRAAPASRAAGLPAQENRHGGVRQRRERDHGDSDAELLDLGPVRRGGPTDS